MVEMALGVKAVARVLVGLVAARAVARAAAVRAMRGARACRIRVRRVQRHALDVLKGALQHGTIGFCDDTLTRLHTKQTARRCTNEDSTSAEYHAIRRGCVAL